eukprot:TRINITY_DN1588_c0_g1_i2.p1 TRINITY_DN1588_c0_g1~~TRINITY_DN1588_c0_g1_i2.p1  ORF type:complete len:262 (+),score=99.96 TRINITY_DN1588_c0_g1_i2:382-1167(+)
MDNFDDQTIQQQVDDSYSGEEYPSEDDGEQYDPVLGDIQVEEIESTITKNGEKKRVIEYVRMLTPAQKKIIQRRENWVKFGECSGVVGPEPGITEKEDPIDFILGNEEKQERLKQERLEREKKEMEKIYNNIIGVTTWQAKKAGEIYDRLQRDRDGPGQNGDPNVYRPPGRRGEPGEEPKLGLRVTNLGEDCTDEALEDLFRPFGPIQRKFLAKDDEGYSKGYAFVNYYNEEDAARALEALNKTGWNHMILSVEYAKPKKY